MWLTKACLVLVVLTSVLLFRETFSLGLDADGFVDYQDIGDNDLTYAYIDMSEHVPGEPLSPLDFQNAQANLEPIAPSPFAQDPIELAGFYEGDILLTEEQNQSSSINPNVPQESTKNAIIKETQKWPGGVIPYYISNQFSALERSTIARAFLEYQSQTCVTFRPRTTEFDYINIIKGNGCSSHVGKTGGAQPVILGNGCVFVGITMHELMHAVGFWHEQSRWDREDFVNIHYENIAPGMDFNFKKYHWKDIQNLSVPYDTGSILHYGPTAFSKDRKAKTITPKIPNPNMGQRTKFSQYDILKINRLYSCNGPISGSNGSGTATTPSPAPTPRCTDNHQNCPIWSQRGECKRSPTWMEVNCRKSCDQCNTPCVNRNQYCPLWSQRGECKSRPNYMSVYCAKSCGTCIHGTSGPIDAIDGGTTSDTVECKDNNAYCLPWANRGECTKNPSYMLSNCKKSCKVCVH